MRKAIAIACSMFLLVTTGFFTERERQKEPKIEGSGKYRVRGTIKI